jgi:hypothetical protein
LKGKIKISDGKTNHSEKLCADERTILKWILKTGCEGTHCINLAEDGDRWRALVDTEMKLQIP